MLLGIEGTYPSEDSLRYLWKSVMAGRLEESFSPGSSVILEKAPMPGAIPARGWFTRAVYRLVSHIGVTRIAPFAGLSEERQEALIHDSWKNMFLLNAENGTAPINGCKGFFMIRSSEEVANWIGCGESSLCDRLDAVPSKDFPALLSLIPEIVASMDWFLGGSSDWHSSRIDRFGKIIKPKTY